MLWMLKWIKYVQATQIVAGTYPERKKMKLIELLNKLNEFHPSDIYSEYRNLRTAGQRYWKQF